ncbi:MAG: MgtC/SapB family protein [Ruminococcaceae bacterium]|nr:MgtC/SapB family protein [Oscillospiraceae bacterium]
MDWFYHYDLHFILRLLVACVCGIVIGIERKSRAKEAGIRTHCIVACAAALMMIISKYAYEDMTGSLIKLDPSRVASGVASGVGFLGAGMIYVHKRTISGLTTAAGIWATAGVGLTIGAGMYVLGLSATLIVLLVQLILHTNAKWLQRPKQKRFYLQCGDEPEMQQYAMSVFQDFNIIVNDIDIKKDVQKGTMEYRFLLEIPSHLHESDLMSRFDCDCSLMLYE